MKFPMFIKDLYAMVECICHNNILVHAKTETMWRVELAQTTAWLTNLASTRCVHTALFSVLWKLSAVSASEQQYLF